MLNMFNTYLFHEQVLSSWFFAAQLLSYAVRYLHHFLLGSHLPIYLCTEIPVCYNSFHNFPAVECDFNEIVYFEPIKIKIYYN